jgi:hypothetical protein
MKIGGIDTIVIGFTDNQHCITHEDDLKFEAMIRDILPSMYISRDPLVKVRWRVELPRPWSAERILTRCNIVSYMSTMWKSLTEKVYGNKDYRLRSERNQALLKPWLEACAKEGVNPADWLHWAMMDWKQRHGNIKTAAPFFSTKRILLANGRYWYERDHYVLGDRSFPDKKYMEFYSRYSDLRDELRLLVRRNGPTTTRADMMNLVPKYFPNGIENSAKILQLVHQRCTEKQNLLDADIASGVFVWDVHQL